MEFSNLYTAADTQAEAPPAPAPAPPPPLSPRVIYLLLVLSIGIERDKRQHTSSLNHYLT
jgi:hypothetical protein